jgi:hypothetical protein
MSALDQSVGAASARGSALFRSGFILGRGSDWIWFLGLPFAAVGIALLLRDAAADVGVQVGISMALWITIPHYAATFLRTYGFADEFQRWRTRFLVFPVAAFLVLLFGMALWPILVIGLIQLWDHQHSLMQQYGFSRIYDLKAGTGAPSTRRFDLLLSWVLFPNLLIASPFWTHIWRDGLAYFGLSLSDASVGWIHAVSWTVTGSYLLIYAVHVLWSLAHGHRINPFKYLFLGGSYFLWYFVAWQAEGLLMYHIAHRLMHGLQYDVMVYSYVQRKVEKTGIREGFVPRLAGHLGLFLLIGLVFAVGFNFVIGHGLEEFSFGLLRFQLGWDSLRDLLGVGSGQAETIFGVFSVTVVYTLAVTHYYFDAFIWKVRDVRTQQGL